MEGTDCTVIAWGTMVHICQEAINDSGVSCDLIDLQTLVPWDRDTVVSSVKKTGRCVIVHEDPKTSGFGAEMSASIQERCFYHLEAPISESQDGILHSLILLNGIISLVPTAFLRPSGRHRRIEHGNLRIQTSRYW